MPPGRSFTSIPHQLNRQQQMGAGFGSILAKGIKAVAKTGTQAGDVARKIGGRAAVKGSKVGSKAKTASTSLVKKTKKPKTKTASGAAGGAAKKTSKKKKIASQIALGVAAAGIGTGLEMGALEAYQALKKGASRHPPGSVKRAMYEAAGGTMLDSSGKPSPKALAKRMKRLVAYLNAKKKLRKATLGDKRKYRRQVHGYGRGVGKKKKKKKGGKGKKKRKGGKKKKKNKKKKVKRRGKKGTRSRKGLKGMNIGAAQLRYLKRRKDIFG